MRLLLTRVQRHHEALNALGLLMQGQLADVEDRKNAVLFVFGLHRRQHRPGHHIVARRQVGKGAVGAVHAGALPHRKIQT